MYGHIQLGARDIAALTEFYDAVLSELHLTRINELGKKGAAGVIWRGTNARWPQFVLNEPVDGRPANQANGSQISFLCDSTGMVDAAWKTAMANSAVDVGSPGLREQCAVDFYAAYCRDPEGHKLCFVHTGP